MIPLPPAFDTVFQTPPTAPEEIERDPMVDKMAKPKPAYDYDNYYKPQIEALLSDWREEEKRVEIRRKVRMNRVNVRDQQQTNAILVDETVISDRTIDSNVKLEKAAYMNYIEQSRRMLMLRPPVATPVDPLAIELMENWFTDGVRYTRWKQPWYKISDGAVFHGCNFLEVIFDETKPLKSAIEFVAREDFIFPVTMKDTQMCELVLRRYQLSPAALDAWKADPSLGFNQKILSDVLMKYEKEKRNKLVDVYKGFFKKAGVVYYFWYSNECKDTWLREPAQLDLGLKVQGGDGQYVPAPVPVFPFFPLKYQELEDEVVLNIQGRASIDNPTQEAATSLMSSIVNGARRASGFYPFKKPGGLDVGGQGGAFEMKHGQLSSGDIGSIQLPWPNPSVLSVLQALSVRNATQMGRTDFAALTRNDTEKTATEIKAAHDQTATLSSMQVMLLADCVLSAYSLSWEIARSQALAGTITLPVPPEVLSLNYTLAPAGDIEVVQRAEKKAALKEAWPIVAQTPAAGKFFEIMMTAIFPEEAPAILAAMNQPNNQQLVGALAEALIKILPDIKDEGERRDLEQLIGIAQHVAQPNGDPSAAGQNNQQAAGAPAGGNGQGK